MTTAQFERIATLALDTFSSLPSKCKPRTLPDGRKEWTPMSAVALSQPTEICNVKLVSLATGTKSLPVSALTKCNGLILHDCHAEILALRGFNYWLLTEMREMLDSSSYVSDWLELTPPRCQMNANPSKTESLPFRFRKGTEITLFSTEAPCGDASMELLMSATEAAGRDITPWSVAPGGQNDIGGKLPLGRGCFSDLGALRRKPARADAEISMSKSCTDKLMLKQFTSLMAFPTDLLLELTEEAFLKRMIVYKDRYNEEGYSRAFGAHGRLLNVLSTTDPDTVDPFTTFSVETLPESFRRFDFEKGTENQKGQKSRASNISALWVAKAGQEERGDDTAIIEVLLNGVKQGFKQFDDRDRKGSVVCRRQMVQEFYRIGVRLAKAEGSIPLLSDILDLVYPRYSDLKARSPRPKRAVIKQLVLDGLGGWPQKHREDDFSISMPALET